MAIMKSTPGHAARPRPWAAPGEHHADQVGARRSTSTTRSTASRRPGATSCSPTTASPGKDASRPEWDRALMYLRSGDTLLVTKLDRIGRSLINLIDVVGLLRDRGVGIRCLDQGEIDTTSASGELMFSIMAALAQWEAAMARERTEEGLVAARARYHGKLPVRGPAVTGDQIKTARMLLSRGDMSAARVAEVIGVGPGDPVPARAGHHLTARGDRAGRRSGGPAAAWC